MRLRKIFKRTAIGAVGYMVAGAQLGNHIFPTPAEFAAKQGMAYSPETMKFLHQHDDVRVVENNFSSRALFCATNPISCYSRWRNRVASDTSFMTAGYAGLLGNSDIVFLWPKKDLAKRDILEIAGKEPVNPAMTDDIAFSFSLFHELAHAENWKTHIKEFVADKDKAGKNRLTTLQGENYADVVAMKHILREHGSAGAKYIVTMRSLYFSDFDHDTLFNVLPAAKPDIKADHQHSATSFYNHSVSCFGDMYTRLGFPEDFPPTRRNIYDQTYICLKRGYKYKQPQDEEFQTRRQSFIVSYEYAFNPSADFARVSQREKEVERLKARPPELSPQMRLES